MPIDYQRDDSRRLITVTVTEPFSLDELLALVDRQWTEGAWGHALLYDVRATARSASREAFERVVDRVQVVGQGRRRGPIGVVIPLQPRRLRVALRLAALPASPQNLEVLTTREQLEGWLRRCAPLPGIVAKGDLVT
jgi:hypothetical protein